MNHGENLESLSLNAREMSIGELNAKLNSISSAISTIEIENCHAIDMLAPGFQSGCRVSIQGKLGDYCLCGVSKAEIEVQGGADCGLGEAMESGSIIVHGDSGDATGAFNRGGLIAICGNAGRRTAGGMCGGDVVVQGSIGSQGAFAMRDGSLLVFGNAGAMLGQGMTGGTIYIRGAIESTALELEVVRMRDSDRLRIGLILLKSGLKGDVRDFRVLKVAGT